MHSIPGPAPAALARGAKGGVLPCIERRHYKPRLTFASGQESTTLAASTAASLAGTAAAKVLDPAAIRLPVMAHMQLDAAARAFYSLIEYFQINEEVDNAPVARGTHDFS